MEVPSDIEVLQQHTDNVKVIMAYGMASVSNVSAYEATSFRGFTKIILDEFKELGDAQEYLDENIARIERSDNYLEFEELKDQIIEEDRMNILNAAKRYDAALDGILSIYRNELNNFQNRKNNPPSNPDTTNIRDQDMEKLRKIITPIAKQLPDISSKAEDERSTWEKLVKRKPVDKSGIYVSPEGDIDMGKQKLNRYELMDEISYSLKKEIDLLSRNKDNGLSI